MVDYACGQQLPSKRRRDQRTCELLRLLGVARAVLLLEQGTAAGNDGGGGCIGAAGGPVEGEAAAGEPGSSVAAS